MTLPTTSGFLRRRGVRLLAVAALGLVPLGAGSASAATSDGDTAVSVDRPYVKANGRAIPAGDAISACGENRRQQNEPTAAVDPSQPSIVTSGSNDYCTVELAGGTWAGFYRSTDRGQTWTDSLLPGYPTDTSPEGLMSPLHQQGIMNAGDPVQAWDNDGRLFYMGNAFNRTGATRASVWVATYDQNASRYVRTRIVGQGTPSRNFQGRFNDKTAIEVDRSNSQYEGNVYTAWSLFNGSGANSIQFSRSTDHGASFSQPIRLSEGVQGNQFADITVTSDGTVYVAWRQFPINRTQSDAMVYAKSTDGGRTFSKPRVAVTFEPFDAADFYGDPDAAARAHEQAFKHADGPAPEAGAEKESVGNARDCGSGPFSCQSGYVFFRHDTQVRITADPYGDAGTVYAVFDAIVPGTEQPSNSTYNTADYNGTLRVGQGAIYLTKTTNGGGTWSNPQRLAPSAVGHQLFPDISADQGRLFAIWHDSRNDPAYSVQNPPGNASATDAQGYHLATRGLDTYGASSNDGGSSWSLTRLSTQSQMPNYEMFGDRQVPFHGDYNYVSNVGDFAFGTWTDTREVRPGDDPRYAGGQQFDVYQCRTKDANGVWSIDTCPNAGGLDQDIYGAAMRP